MADWLKGGAPMRRMGLSGLVLLGTLSPAAAISFTHAVLPADVGTVQLAQVDPADQSVRVVALEQQVRTLSGQIEQLTHTIQQLQAEVQRLSGVPAVASVAPAPGFSATPAPALGADTRDPLIGSVAGAGGTFASGELGTTAGAPLDLSAAAAGATIYPLPDAAAPGALPGSLPGVPSADPLQTEVASIAPPADPQDAYDDAYSYLTSGNYPMAETSFQRFIADYPTSELAGNAHFWLGEARFSQSHFRDAADEFLETYRSYPTSAKAPDSLLRLGQSLVELDQAEAACATWGEFMTKFSGSAAPALVQAVELARTAASCA